MRLWIVKIEFILYTIHRKWKKTATKTIMRCAWYALHINIECVQYITVHYIQIVSLMKTMGLCANAWKVIDLKKSGRGGGEHGLLFAVMIQFWPEFQQFTDINGMAETGANSNKLKKKWFELEILRFNHTFPIANTNYPMIVGKCVRSGIKCKQPKPFVYQHV